MNRSKKKLLHKIRSKKETVFPFNPERKTEGGLRTKGYYKKSHDNLPLISIIIVSLNEVKYIESTIKSIINQTYKNTEIIVIDGGSDDGTVNILQQYNNIIDYWISEPDKGIYNGWNKGIDLANGEWLNVKGVGDKFVKSLVVEKVVNKILSENRDADLIHGDMIYDPQNTGFSKRFKPRPIETLYLSVPISISSLFVKSSIQKKHKFNEKFKIAGDYDFLVTCYLEKYKFCYTKMLIADMRPGGISSKVTLRLITEDYLIQKRIKNDYKLKVRTIKRVFYTIRNSIIRTLKKFAIGRLIIKLVKKIK